MALPCLLHHPDIIIINLVRISFSPFLSVLQFSQRRRGGLMVGALVCGSSDISLRLD